MALEIEKKFIIKKLSTDALEALGARKKEINQSYLLPSSDFPVRRIRKVVFEGNTTYYYTLKRPSSGSFTREEIEQEISENQYLGLQKEGDFSLNEIVKTRFIIESDGLVYEVDRFPFFVDFDLLEIELPSEDFSFTIPKEIEILKDVTTDYRFTNIALAKEIPNVF